MALGPGHYEGYYGAAKYVDQNPARRKSRGFGHHGTDSIHDERQSRSVQQLGIMLPNDLAAKVDEWY